MSIFSKKAVKNQVKARNSNKQESAVSTKSNGPEFWECLGEGAGFNLFEIKREPEPWELSTMYYNIYVKGRRAYDVLRSLGFL